ncbi:MAG: NAD(P)H-binding protein [Prolixibacteraceae bacterium]|nr:NAD(P)H-binding protein [Prolixibacteraceae bacterium]
MKKTEGKKLEANVIGATGLVGKQLVKLLLENDRVEKVRIFVRKDSGIKHPKLEQHIVDFNDSKTWSNKLKGDVLFSALGTTIKQAGSKEKQYDIDVVLNRNFANAAKENGIENYVLVSSIGANSKSKMFYLHIKGKLDDTVSTLGFKNLVILRPASLVGERIQQRLMENISVSVLNLITQFMFKEYRPIHGKTVAKAMINSVLNPDLNKTIWEGTEIFELADEK